MGVKKGTHNAKNYQKKKVEVNFTKIKNCLDDIKGLKFEGVNELICFVSKKTGIHRTTMKKNKEYYDYCELKFRKLASKDLLPQLSEMDNLKSKNRLLENEVAILNNQVTGFKNLIAKMQNSGESSSNTSEKELKTIVFKLLKHFDKFLEVSKTEIVDPHAGIRPVIIYKNEKLAEILT